MYNNQVVSWEGKRTREEKCSGWEKDLKTFQKNLKKFLTNWKRCDRINKLSQESTTNSLSGQRKRAPRGTKNFLKKVKKVVDKAYDMRYNKKARQERATEALQKKRRGHEHWKLHSVEIWVNKILLKETMQTWKW